MGQYVQVNLFYLYCSTIIDFNCEKIHQTNLNLIKCNVYLLKVKYMEGFKLKARRTVVGVFLGKMAAIEEGSIQKARLLSPSSSIMAARPLRFCSMKYCY